MNNWRDFYQVHITLRCGIRHVPFKSGNSLECMAYAFDKVAPNDDAFDRIEVRDYFGESVVQVIWISSREIAKVNERINRQDAA